MTGYGPPGPPQPPPGGYGPPPQSGGGGYGPPPGGGYGGPTGGDYGIPKKAFDPKSVNPLDWGILAAALLAFIFSFISYYTVGADASGASCPPGLQGQIDRSIAAAGSDASGSAWHGFFGWFGVILALIGAVLIAIAIFAPQVRLPVPARLVALGAFVLGLIFTLLALLVDPATLPPDVSVLSGCKVKYSFGHGFGYWATLIVIAAGTVLAFLRLQQTGQLPGRGSAGGKAGSGVSYGEPSGYGQPPAQGPPGGYGAQPPQGSPGGYGAQPPQGSPGGYGAPPPQGPPQGPPSGYSPPAQEGPPPGYGPPPQPGPSPNPGPGPGPQPGYGPPQ